MTNLSDIVEESGNIKRWVTFIPGFDVEIGYLNRTDVRAMYQRSLRKLQRARQETEKLDEPRFHRELAKHILSWRGLNEEILRQFFPIKASADLNGKEIECTEEHKIFMLREAPDFDNFIYDALTSLEAIKQEEFNDELKNSDALSPES
jgi:hypothetical protein